MLRKSRMKNRKKTLTIQPVLYQGGGGKESKCKKACGKQAHRPENPFVKRTRYYLRSCWALRMVEPAQCR